MRGEFSSTVAQDFTGDELSRAMTAANDLRSLFGTPWTRFRPEREDDGTVPELLWNARLYSLVEDGLYEVIGSCTGPDGRQYAATYVLSEEEIARLGAANIPDAQGGVSAPPPLRTIRDYRNLNIYAYERGGGLAFYGIRDLSIAPHASLPFGAVWSYLQFGGHGGCRENVDQFFQASNVSPYDQFYATVNDSEQTQWSELSDELLPPSIRVLIVQELKTHLPQARPEFFLVRRDQYAMPFKIYIDTHTEGLHDVKDALAQSLNWYASPYLPIGVI